MKKREVNRFIKERRDSNGKLFCLIPTCDNYRQKYKTTNNTRNYCKNHTYEDMGEFTNWQALRKKALKRDNFTCVKCGDDREEVEITVKSKRITNWEEAMNSMNGKFKYEYFERKEMGTNFIGDHITPIALGGDQWDINNIQTLCLACNKIKTSEDMKNIATLRQKEKLDNYKNIRIVK